MGEIIQKPVAMAVCHCKCNTFAEGYEEKEKYDGMLWKMRDDRFPNQPRDNVTPIHMYTLKQLSHAVQGHTVRMWPSAP